MAKTKNTEKIYLSEKRWDIDWYKALQNSGINEFLIQKRNKESKFLIQRCTPTHGRYWGLLTLDQIYKHLNSNKYLYEILEPHVNKKVYFDIDGNNKTKLEEIKDVILFQFQNANLQISGYESAEKHSYHIILSNYLIINDSDMLKIKTFAAKHKLLGFDTAVYGKFNCFKCINQSKSKKESPVQSYIEGSKNLTKHLVLNDFDEDLLYIDDLKWEVDIIDTQVTKKEKFKKNVEILSINSSNKIYECPNDFDIINAYSYEKLALIPNPSKETTKDYLKGDVIIKIMSWCKCEQMDFEKFWTWNKSKNNSESRYYKYKKLWNLSEYNISENFINNILYKFYPFLIEDRSRQRYRLLNDIKHSHFIEDNFFDSKYIDNNVKYTYLDIKMGGNKTGAIIEYIKNLDEKSTILYISPRIALSKDLQNRMKKNNLNFDLYSDFKGVEKELIKNCTNLIMSISSFHRLTDCNFNYIIIDEIETVLDSFKGEANTHKDQVETNWLLFLRMLKTSQKVIVMDALLSNKTIKTLKNNDPNESEILTLTSKQDPRSFLRYNNNQFNQWLDSIINSIKNNEKIFIFMPYKISYDFQKRHQLASVNSLVKFICNYFNLTENEDVIGYYSEQKENKENLKHIEYHWNKAKIIIANTCIAVGNNYSGKDFTRIYAYFSSWLETRDFIQVLYRVRNPIDKQIHVFYERGIYKKDIYKRERIKIHCKSFEILQKGFDIEQNAKPKDKLDIISNRCNILTITNANTESSSNWLSQINMDFTVKLEDVKTIHNEEYFKLISKRECGLDNFMERLAIEKYQLVNKFKKGTPINILDLFWQSQINYHYRLQDLLKPQNIINKILEAQDINGFFDLELDNHHMISKLKVHKSISNDSIKQHFKLHNGIQNTNIQLIARIFNSFFNHRILVAVQDNKKKYKRIRINKVYYCEYEFIDEFIELFDYWKEYSYTFQTYLSEIKDSKKLRIKDCLIESDTDEKDFDEFEFGCVSDSDYSEDEFEYKKPEKQIVKKV